MKVGIGHGRTIEVEETKGFSGKRYKWFDYFDTERSAKTKATQIRKTGAKVRVVPTENGFSVYTYALRNK